MLRPKRSLHKMKESASRQFTDRKEPKESFRKALQSLQENRYKVLVFYGVGGIGKSRLLKELYLLTDNLVDTTVKISIDFREEKHRNLQEALIWLREQLTTQFKVKFTTFDLAYAIYWRKMKPQITLKSEQVRIPFLEEGSFAGELISQLENIPIAQWIPKTIKLIDGFSQYKEILQWWTGIGKEVLSDLREMNPKDIEDMLLVYWATDFKKWMETSNRQAVFFFDTYEALWEKDRSTGSFTEKDEWIREFILQFEDIPVLNVICGREKLTWEKIEPEWSNHVEQHLMGGLSIPDCKSFLSSCGIKDESIQEAIIRGSEGLPYYLDLMVDTYQLVQRKQTAAVDDFSKRPDEVLQRFLRYLDRPEKETLKVLSIPRFWSENLFAELVTEFKTFYPITAFEDLCQFSFIHQNDQGYHWTMHNLMRVGLNEQVLTLSPSLFNKIHLFLFRYYTNKLRDEEATVDRSVAFVESLYHGEFILSDNELVEWLSQYSFVLLNSGKWSILILEFKRILESKTSKRIHAFSHQMLGELFALQGQYKLAERHCIEAIDLYKGEEDFFSAKETCLYRTIAKIQRRLGDLHRNTNQYMESIQSFKSALENLEKITKDDTEALEESALILTRLGKIYKFQTDYSQAEQFYKKALDICKKIITLGLESSSTYAILGQVYEKLGELHNDELQEDEGRDPTSLYEAIDAYEYAIQDKEMVDFIPVLAHLGLAHKRLAEYLSKYTQAKEKVENFQKAIEIYNEVITLAPDYVDGYEMRGHVAVDLLDLQTDLGNFKEGLESFQLAVRSFEVALELSENQGSSRNRLSSAYRSLGRMYQKQKNYSLAMEAFELAVQKNNVLFSYSPEYIYSYNTRGRIYKEMGDCYLEMGNNDDAVRSYERALLCFKTSLERLPNSKTALAHIKQINELLSQLH